MKSKHTKGVARIYNTKAIFEKRESLGIDVEHEKYCRSIILFQEGEAPSDTTGEEDLANAQLIVDAFNVANETGMTPRELQKSHAELLGMLIESRQKLYDLNPIKETYPIERMDEMAQEGGFWDRMNKAITNATKK